MSTGKSQNGVERQSGWVTSEPGNEPRQIQDRLRICILTTEYASWGGMGKSVHRIACSLAKSNLDITVVTIPQEGLVVSTEPTILDGIPVYVVPEYLKPAQAFIDALDRERPFDLFHCLPLGAGSLFDIASRGSRPVVSSIRGIDGLLFNLQAKRAKAALLCSHWITSVSKASLDRASSVVDISSRSSFIPNGVDANSFERWRPTPENQGVVGTVCTIRPKKNIPLLIRAYSRLPVALRRKLLLVGDCPDLHPNNLEARRAADRAIAELGLPAEAEITGTIDHKDVGSYLSALGVFVLSSDHEGLPNTILEAAAAGVPIVATCVDGVKDILTDEYDALLVPPGDCDALAAAVQRVLADTALARRLSDAAWQTGRKYSVEAERDAYVSLYERLIAENRSSAYVTSSSHSHPAP